MSLKVKYDAMVQMTALERSKSAATAALQDYKNGTSSLLAAMDANAGGDFSADDRAALVAEINSARAALQNFLNNWPAAN